MQDVGYMLQSLNGTQSLSVKMTYIKFVEWHSNRPHDNVAT